jgi:hypothetical protein
LWYISIIPSTLEGAIGGSWLKTLSFFLFFSGTGIWIQGLILARQALYHLNHPPTPACFFETRSCYVTQAGLSTTWAAPPVQRLCLKNWPGCSCMHL